MKADGDFPSTIILPTAAKYNKNFLTLFSCQLMIFKCKKEIFNVKAQRREGAQFLKFVQGKISNQISELNI